MKKCILVVDDNSELLSSLVEFLHYAEYIVFSAGDGLEALQLLREHTPDVIITDIVMPGIGGLDFIKALRSDSRLQGIPVIVFSATTQFNIREEALTIGANEFVGKPASMDTLLVMIEQVTGDEKAEI